MEWWWALSLIVGGLLIVMATGLPIAFCFLIINLIGVYVFFGGISGLNIIGNSVFDSLTSFTLVPIVMFILMGELLFHSGTAIHMIDTLDKWMGRLPGRLGLLAVAGGTLLSVLSGSSLSTTAILGSLLTPEMERRGYKKPMSLGPILGSGGLSIMIPPSSLAVILATIGEISVARILLGSIIPGLLMAFLYASYIILRCWLQPSIAPSFEVRRPPLSEMLVASVHYVLPVVIVVFLVTGVIFMGIATPSEAAATGVLGVLILAALNKSLTWQAVKKSVWSTFSVSVMVYLIIMASTTFGQILGFSGASRGLVTLATSFPIDPILLLVAMQVVLLVLGMFMNPVSMIMITFPIFMPIIHALGFNDVWFGIIVLLNMEMATTTPPFGTTLFVMKAAAPPDTTMGDVYKAGLPFLGCDLIVMVLMIAFPIIALWLPGLML